MVKITSFWVKQACVLLVILMLSSMVVVGSEGDYGLYYEDPQEYLDFPDVDLKSLSSRVENDYLVIELKTYGKISYEPEYSYSIYNSYSSSEQYWFDFYFSDGEGTLYYESGDFFIELNNVWDVSDDTLTVRVSLQYIFTPEQFDLSASADYFPLDNLYGYISDNINWEPFSFFDSSYNFDEAIPMDIPGTAGGMLEEEDSCVYTFELEAGTGVQIEMTASFKSWPYFTIFNSEKQYITSSMTEGRSSTLTFVPQTDGIYYLGIDGWSVSGRYKITTSLRGLSGEDYQKGSQENVPWQTGDSWTAGVYISTDEIMSMMLAGDKYWEDEFIHKYSSDGGLAHFMVVTYAGKEGDGYKFDYESRLYCDMSLNMTFPSTMYYWESDDSFEEYMNFSVIADISYEGSIWLGFYENGQGDAYYGIEKQTISLNASFDIYSEMTFSDFCSGTDCGYYRFESRSINKVDLDLTKENTPGIPFLPAEDRSVEVDKKVSTTVTGHSYTHTRTSFNSSDADFLDFYTDDMDHTYDNDFNDSYTWYYILEYDSETKIAETTPALTDPFSYLFMGMYQSYGYVDGVAIEDSHNEWLDQPPSKATYHPDSGFYSAFELPLTPFGSSGVPMDASVGGGFMLSSLAMTDISPGLSIGGTSQDEANLFFDDPEEYMSMKEAGQAGSDPLPFIIISLALVFIAAVSVVFACELRKMNAQQKEEVETPYEYGEE